MKKIIVSILIVVFISIVSCGKEKKEPVKNISIQQEEVVIASDEDLDRTDSKSEVVFEDEHITRIYKHYLGVKRGLVNSNVSVVRQEARKMEALIAESAATKQLKATTKLISLTRELKKQRDFFVTLTSETEKLISQSTITSGAVYKQYCPMALDKNGGYWLSDSEEIRNPYFGKSMLICGNVNKTIK
ncbi:DUF3347 domain-containing protein [Aquimarina sp. RZ0]|uniref:DUF3347 domain-containing protein n=1 Tax=Aquimarina sp. RZ0 TaxID=2607730 RepID=UPI0011F3C469|nr:DUF3347 domain-containing protein [Aquimarina sp. RZ0]KAA1242398.1 DUF3347 domain-containing protein [Aquimarina sp. RZ0]